ncbi:annulin isoform X2 [Folsomia candida]|uniref:annulin isoform X2 n=1 Tax=Folsomia candida TaxID=158441 RepID=UPI0016050688|nr:annulin isoform X2 [Folsomia candida]
MFRNRRIRVLDPIFNYQPPKWLPLPTYVRRRQDRHNRWPPYRDDGNIDILKVFKVDLICKENGPIHQTEKYDLMLSKPDQTNKLVIRRGQEFWIKIFFNRPYSKDTDGISFVFSIVDGKPSLSHGTLVLVPLLSKGSLLFEKTPTWTAYIDEIDENAIKVQFKTSATCSVGKWKLAIDTKRRDDQTAVSYSLDNPIYILFNPWNADDEVYMEEDELRHECVLEDSGLIWRGSHTRLRPTPWAYSQFEKDVLDCALYILSGPSRLSSTARADPVKCVRAISAAVNSPDEDGVVEGNWSDKFDGGVPPINWTGSLKILRKYYSSKKPVKFGQCWVFAGVVTSICRAIGIPCRPVTNYQSAHDTQSSVTVDYFLDDDGKPIEKLNTDSVWNFHVWNEAWMLRTDLGDSSETAGWQVIDATPQEKSDEMYQCGPASVLAVRRGEIKRPFDGTFVFSEVNADKVYWHFRGPNRPLKLLGTKQDVIGMLISTKAVGKFDRDDITHTYKYPEKSSKEREAMLNALRTSESLFSRYYLNEDFNDVRFDFPEIQDDIVIGSSFKVRLIVTNVNEEKEYDVTASLRVDTMLYTGKVKAEVKKEVFLFTIPPKSKEEISMEITYNDYAPKLCNQCAFNVACLASVDETDYEYFAQDDFRARKPDIKFDIRNVDGLIVGQPFKGTVKLKNPLPVPLTKGQFLIESPGLGEPLKLNVKEKVEPGESATADFQLVAQLDGEKTISAKFNSRELDDVDGFVKITIGLSNEISNEITSV